MSCCCCCRLFLPCQDTLGRLWWTEKVGEKLVSCAYRRAEGEAVYYGGYLQVKWETAPACPQTPTLINSMPDAQFRLWGWIESDINCKFVTSAGEPVMKDSLA